MFHYLIFSFYTSVFLLLLYVFFTGIFYFPIWTFIFVTSTCLSLHFSHPLWFSALVSPSSYLPFCLRAILFLTFLLSLFTSSPFFLYVSQCFSYFLFCPSVIAVFFTALSLPSLAELFSLFFSPLLFFHFSHSHFVFSVSLSSFLSISLSASVLSSFSHSFLHLSSFLPHSLLPYLSIFQYFSLSLSFLYCLSYLLVFSTGLSFLSVGSFS